MSLNKEKIVEEFKEYVENFDCSNENIIRKYYHSIRVMDFAEEIANSENLKEDDIELSVIIGLLHDYGRFEQWTNYQTFNDLKSIDHGDLGVQILFQQNHIEKFYNKKENYNIIYNAIKYHNKYGFPDSLDEKAKTMCKIIRDADKLDIINLLISGDLKFKSSNEEISENIKNDFLKCKLINRKDVKNANDANLSKLAMLYDYNYKFSYEYTINNNVLKRLYNKVENKEMFKEYFDYMEKFLNKKYEGKV